MCSMILKESNACYLSHLSPVFCAVLNVSKAFDRLGYTNVFKLLIKRKLRVVAIRLLISFYVSKFLCVSWGGEVSGFLSSEW